MSWYVTGSQIPIELGNTAPEWQHHSLYTHARSPDVLSTVLRQMILKNNDGTIIKVHKESDNDNHRITYFGVEVYNVNGDLCGPVDENIKRFLELKTEVPRILYTCYPVLVDIPKDVILIEKRFAKDRGFILSNKVEKRAIEKKFTFLASRLDIYRLETFLRLIDADLLEDGAVSFSGLDSFLRDTTTPNTTGVRELTDKFFDSQNFANAVNKALEITPYKNFTENIQYDPKEDKFLQYAKNSVKSWQLGKVFMVHETYPQSEEIQSMIFYSEKTVLMLQTPRPFVLLSSRLAVAKLRECGFKVFDEYVNHASYDNEYSTVTRNELATHELFRLINELEPKDADIDLWHEYAEHNRQLLLSTLGDQAWDLFAEEKSKILLELIKTTEPESYKTIVSACKQQRDML